jgi:hypothetical protein
MNNQSVIIENIIQNLSLELYLPMGNVDDMFKRLETKIPRGSRIIVGTVFDSESRQHHNITLKDVNKEEQSNGKTALSIIKALDERIHDWLSNQSSNYNIPLNGLSAVIIYLPISMSFNNLTDTITKTLTRQFKLKDESDEKNTNNFNIKIISEASNQHMIVYYSTKDKAILEWISSLSNTSSDMHQESLHYSLSRAYKQIFIEGAIDNLKTVLVSKKHPKPNLESKPEEDRLKDMEHVPETQPEDLKKKVLTDLKLKERPKIAFDDIIKRFRQEFFKWLGSHILSAAFVPGLDNNILYNALFDFSRLKNSDLEILKNFFIRQYQIDERTFLKIVENSKKTSKKLNQFYEKHISNIDDMEGPNEKSELLLKTRPLQLEFSDIIEDIIFNHKKDLGLTNDADFYKTYLQSLDYSKPEYNKLFQEIIKTEDLDWDTFLKLVSVYMYTSGSPRFNNLLRQGHSAIEDSDPNKHKNIKQNLMMTENLIKTFKDENMLINELSHDIILFRGDSGGLRHYHHLSPGDILSDKGFLSTTLDPSVLSTFMSSTPFASLYIIHVPSFSKTSQHKLKMLSVSNWGASIYDEEYEILLPPGSLLYVVGIESIKDYVRQRDSRFINSDHIRIEKTGGQVYHLVYIGDNMNVVDKDYLEQVRQWVKEHEPMKNEHWFTTINKLLSESHHMQKNVTDQDFVQHSPELAQKFLENPETASISPEAIDFIKKNILEKG